MAISSHKLPLNDITIKLNKMKWTCSHMYTYKLIQVDIVKVSFQIDKLVKPMLSSKLVVHSKFVSII